MADGIQYNTDSGTAIGKTAPGVNPNSAFQTGTDTTQISATYAPTNGAASTPPVPPTASTTTSSTNPPVSPGTVSIPPSTTQSTDVSTLGSATVGSSAGSQPPPYTPPSTPNLDSIINSSAPPSNTQNEYDGVENGINSLIGQLGGQTDFANNLETQYGIPQLTSTANDLTANISQIQNQRDAVQQQLANQYGGDASKGYLDFEQQSVDSVLAAKQSAYASTLATISGQLSTAKSLIDTAVSNKYDPIKNQISAWQAQATALSSTLDREQKAQLQTQQEKVGDYETLRTPKHSHVLKRR